MAYLAAEHQLNLSSQSLAIWLVFVEEIQDVQLLSAYRDILPEDELAVHDRFRFDRHKKRYLIGRALARTMIARYTGLAPAQILFSRESQGRPFLLQSGSNPTLRFSISYTDGLVGIGLTLKRYIGFDLENTNNKINCLEIASNYFSAAEYEELKQLSDPLRKERFFQLWTLKEAYVKAQGGGLQIPLDEMSFHHRAEIQKGSIHFSLIGVDKKRWRFGSCRLDKQYWAAFCVNQDSRSPLEVTYTRTIPLLDQSDRAIS